MSAPSPSNNKSKQQQTVFEFQPSPASLTAKIHPLVLFNVCDSYVRRPDQADRVIGTLLGSVSTDGTVDINNSYAVPHSESSDQVAVSSTPKSFVITLNLPSNPYVHLDSIRSDSVCIVNCIFDLLIRDLLNRLHWILSTTITCLVNYKKVIVGW